MMLPRQVLRSSTANLRRFASTGGSSGKRNYANVHTNNDRQRFASGNAYGFQVVGTVALLAGTASAYAMAYCEEGEESVSRKPTTNVQTRATINAPQIQFEPWRMEAECK